MLQSIENNAGIIGEDLALLHNYYVMCALNRLLTCVEPGWANACKLVLLIQPSSAAAERVFSLLENSFTERQERSLQDNVSLAIMLQYNSKH